MHHTTGWKLLTRREPDIGFGLFVFEMGFLVTRTTLKLWMCYMAEDDLELLTLLPPPPECLGYSVHVASLIFCLMLELVPRVSWMLPAFYQLSYLPSVSLCSENSPFLKVELHKGKNSETSSLRFDGF